MAALGGISTDPGVAVGPVLTAEAPGAGMGTQRLSPEARHVRHGHMGMSGRACRLMQITLLREKWVLLHCFNLSFPRL